MGCPHCGCRLLTKADNCLITMLLVVLIGGVALSLSMLTDFVGRDSFTLQDKP